MDRDTSSLTMTLLAVGWEMVALFALDRVTVKASSFSTSRSPVASTVMVAVLWPAAKLTWPDGIAPPKSVASASPDTLQSAVVAWVRSPVRVTVKVKAVVPLSPSAWLTESAAMLRSASSLTMRPEAAPVPICALPEGLLRVTLNASSPSTSRSPDTFRVMVLLVSPAAKVRVSPGRVPAEVRRVHVAGHVPVHGGGLVRVPGAGHGEGVGSGAVVALGPAPRWWPGWTGTRRR